MKTTKTMSFALLVSLVLLNSVQPVHAQSNTYVVKIVARPLPLSAVRIAGGPLKRAQDLNGEYLLKLVVRSRLINLLYGSMATRGNRVRQDGPTSQAIHSSSCLR